MTACAEPETVVSATAEEGVSQVLVTTRSCKKQILQQTLVTLLPQSKVAQDAAVSKLGSKKRRHDDDSKKGFGLASNLRRTRGHSVAVA